MEASNKIESPFPEGEEQPNEFVLRKSDDCKSCNAVYGVIDMLKCSNSVLWAWLPKMASIESYLNYISWLRFSWFNFNYCNSIAMIELL